MSDDREQAIRALSADARNHGYFETADALDYLLDALAQLRADHQAERLRDTTLAANAMAELANEAAQLRAERAAEFDELSAIIVKERGIAHAAVKRGAQLRAERDTLESLVRRAASFVNAVAVMADDKTPSLAWLADAALASVPDEEQTP